MVHAAFSPDGRRVVTASWDMTARIWDAETHRQIGVLAGHEANLYTAAFSPDGRRVVTAARDKTVRIWDAETHQQIAVLEGHTVQVASASFSPDGRRVVTASDDGTVRIWDAETGRQIAVLVEGGSPMYRRLVQPGWPARGDWVPRQDGADLGCRDASADYQAWRT